MFKTLFSRMLATYLTVALALLALLGITAASMFRNQYLQEQEAELRREGEEINTIIMEKYVYTEKRSVAVEELRTIARKYDALIQVIDNNEGKMSFVYPDSEEKWAVIDGVDMAALAASVMDGATAQSVYTGLYKELTDIPIMTLARPVVNAAGEHEGAIFFHVDMSTVYASINQVYVDTLLSSCIGVMLAVIAVSYITGRMTKPIIEMNRIVKRYTGGDFEVRIHQETPDELGQLAQSFNAMAGELNTLEEARRSFVANVSHELRSPLTSMRGFLEAMQDGTIPLEEHSKYLEIVIAENRRMTDMVNDLLDLARIESGQAVIKKEVWDINELIRRTLITFETRISKKKLDIQIDFQEEFCFVEADSSQISQVLRNLIDNAIKFSPEGGILALSTRTNRRDAEIFVKDQGCGMSEEDVQHIFERFYKAEKAHTPKGGTGTGLGLAIVKRIIDQHEQTITVNSILGQGTEFMFTLKRAAETQTRARKAR